MLRHMCLVPIQRLAVRGSDTVDSLFEPGQCSQDVVEAFWLREINVAPGTITVNHRFSFRRRQPVFGLDHPRGVHCGVCAEFSGSFWWIRTILPEGWRRALRASLRTQPGVVHEQRAKPFPKKNLINSRKLVRVCNVPAVQSQQVLCWSQIPVATADGLRWFEHTIYATMPFEPLDIVSVGTFFDLFQKLDGRGLVAGLAGILFRKNHLNFNGDDVHRSLNESSVLQAFTG